MHRRPHALPIIVTKCAFLLLPTLTSAQSTPNQTPATKPAPISNAGRPSSTTGVNSAETAADKTPLPAIVPAGRKSIGIALEGGGALGLAHAGVLAWLEDHHIPIDRIAGTSMGALVGSLYASGKSPAEIQKIAASNAFTNVFTLRTPYAKVDYRRRQDRQELPQGIQVGLKGGPSLRNALLVDSGLNSFLELNLDRYNQSELNYNTLPIPFRCIAADLTTLQSVVFDGGPVPQAVRASISIPGIFAPVEYRGHYLVDGAILDNLPTDIVKQDLHADIVIGVHLKSSSFSDADVSSIVGVFTRAYAAGTARTEHNGESLANILITADTSKFSTADYASANRIIAAGYAAAEQQRALLEPYALNDADWQAYLADRHSREIKRLPILQMVNVQGGTPGARARVASDLAPLKGQPITVTALDKALEPVQGNGAYQASVETFQPSTQAPIDGTQGQNPDTGVRVRLSPVRNGPPFLLIGADVTAESSNVTRTTFDFRLINQNLGGYGSELRSDLRVGFLTQASTEYYRLLSKSSLFLQPHLGILREPVYIWQDQRRISERLLQQAGGGLDFGQTVSRNMQYTFEYRAQVIRWHLVDGEDDTSSVSGTSQTALAHFVYNSRESGTLSPRGTYIDASAGALFDSVQSQTAPILRFTYGHSFPLPSGIIAVSAEGNTYFGRSVAEPLRFTLGGPLRLSASSIDEYRGTDDFLVRAGYLHRLITIPFGVGEGLYATVGYEGGEMWSPENPAILSQDGFLLGLASTPLGVFQFGGAVGDAGHRKVFLSFGRLF